MSFDLTAAYATNSKLVEDGAKMVLTEDSFCIIARIPNEKYTRKLSKEVERHQRLLDLKTDESEKMSNIIMSSVLAETVLIGWEGLVFEGKPIKYSVENAQKVLRAYPDFRRSIVEFANDITNYRSEAEEKTEKK